MLRYIYADALHHFPTLRDTMFRDRAEQFHRRLGWQVKVDEQGEERDEYDDENPLYIVWEDDDGRHGGSMRFLPTTGPTMVNDHFRHLTGGVKITSPLIWECTRFCLAPKADRRASAALVLGAGELMETFRLKHFVGVFDSRMERIYRLLNVEPDVVGSSGTGRDRIGVGLWDFKPEARGPVLEKVGVTEEQSRAWFRHSFGLSMAEMERVLEVGRDTATAEI